MVTRPIAILGHPVGHSLSPTIHNAAFAALGQPPRYVACDVRSESLEEAVRGLVTLGFRGANVTTPHKEAVLPFLDELSDAARAIGAVNTIIVEEDGRLLGDNTDHIGFSHPLRSSAEALRGETALVLGAGGAARAVMYALLHGFPLAGVGIAARTLQHAEQLRLDLQIIRPETRIEILPWPAAAEAAGSARLIVNTTPLGMAPKTEASPLPSDALSNASIVYDLVYNPRQTLLLTAAEAAGAHCIGGLPMLLGQAAEAFRLWTGRVMPMDSVLSAIPENFRK